MIVHVVSLKLKDLKDKQKIIENFLALKLEIRQIQEIQIFDNAYPKREQNYDLIAKIEFDNIANMEEYLIHQKHIDFLENYIKVYVDKVATIDYEV